MTAGRASGPCPSVDPDHLRQALEPLLRWMEAGDGEEGDETIPGLDLRELLNRLAHSFKTDAVTTVALFKRSLALSHFCSENELPATLFENGVPGVELCRAAARLPLIDIPGEDGEEMTHTFDIDAMRAALRLARN